MRSTFGMILGTALAASVVAGCIDPYYGGRHRRGYDRAYDEGYDADYRSDRRYYDEDRDYDRRRYGDERDERLPTLVCASKNGRPARCRTDFPIRRAELDKRYSGSPCTYGRTWGFDRDEVWVTDGCRARFVLFPARRR
jgi:hypothetical protein